MFKKTLIVAGLLSVISVTAQAANTIITNDTIISNAINGVVTSNSGSGGAIVNNGHNLTINANITDNTLENGIGQAVFGGAIYQSGGTLTINNGVKFDGNTVSSKSQSYPNWDGVDGASGGAIYITGDFDLTANGNVIFSNNKALAVAANDESNGGAIFAQGASGSTMSFNNVKFENNSSKNRGGAIYNGDTAIVVNGKGEFIGNTSMTGGAIYNLDVTSNTSFATGTNSTFINNKATGNGGAIANFDGVVNVGQGNSFSGNNAASNGGAIYNANWQKTSVTNISGGTSFTNNSAGDKGGAIYNTGNVKLDTTAGNITFSGNTAAKGADVYLDGAKSSLVVSGTNASNKVSFGSTGSIAGNGSIKHESAGTFELVNNQDTSAFTGKYTQTSGKTSLNNSAMFDKFEINSGELELLNGSTAVINKTDKIFKGSVLTVDDSTLNLKAAIGKDVAVNLQSDGNINLSEGASLVLNNGDKWQGAINTTTGTSLTLDNFTGSEGIYTQSGGSLSLTNGSNLTLSNSGTLISGGTVSIANGNTLSIGNGAVIGGNTNTTVAGTLNVDKGGSIGGGVSAINKDGSAGPDTTVESGGNLNVSGSIEGNANTTIQSGGTVNVNGGTIDTAGKTDIQDGANLNINDGGNVTLHEGDSWEGTITNNNSTLTLDNITHTADNSNGNYIQTEGTLNLNNGSNLTIGEGSSISNGNINIDNSQLNVDNKGQVSGGNINVDNNSQFNVNDGGIVSDGTINIGNGSSFNIAEGGQVTGGHLNFEGNNSIGVEGTILGDAIFDVTNGNTVNITNNGNVTINSNDIWADGTIHLNGGTLNYEGVKNGSNGAFHGDKGNLNISDNFIVDADSYIKDAVNTTINEGSTLQVAGGEVTLGGANDKISGNISISDGKLNLDNAVKEQTGQFTQTGGTTTVSGSFDLNNANDNISGGQFDINGTVNQTQGTISDAANVNLKGTLNIKGGETSLNDNDNWEGNIQLSENGTLNLKDITSNGALVANGGNLNLKNSIINLVKGDSISKDTNVSFDDTNSINIDGGSAAFDGNEWGGTITLKDGNLDFSGTSNGALKADGGNLNVADGSNLVINSGSYIEDAVNADIQGSLSISGADAYVTLGNGDTIMGDIAIDAQGTLNMGDHVTMAESGQTIAINNAVLNLIGNDNLDLKADLVGTNGDINKNGSGNVIFNGETNNYKGDLTINNSGNLTFTDADGFGGNLIFGDIDGKSIGIIADTIIGSTTLDRDATITYSTYRDVDLRFGNTVSVSKGTINAEAKPGQNVSFDNQVIVNDKGTLTASGNNVNFENGITAENGTIITSAISTDLKNLDLTNSNIFINQNGFTAKDVIMNGSSSLNVMNGTITDNSIGNLEISEGSTGNFSIDISARDWESDSFITSSISNTGTVNISDFQFVNKCPIDRYISLKVFDSFGSLDDVDFTATDKEVFTPIGYYKLLSQGGGEYKAALTRYNPQVFRGQVATVANYQNQLVVNNLLFDHTQEVNMQYLAEKNSNKYAAAYPLFAPYQYDKKDGSLWFKTFGTFERLSMTHDLNVNNNFYGTLIGADFPAIELKKGWTLLPTAYIGYLGAHQTFSHVGMYQNGGQGGAMATFMKDDFIGSILAYGGGYGNEMNVAGYTDKTGNWYAGTAAKAAYNFHPSKHFIIQPTLLASYNLFGEQKWHTDFGDMHMYSKMLNGVNAAPGINFIYGRESWSIYATVQYFYNILGYSDGRAGHVNLSGIRMRHGFLEYGFGFTKSWKDRFSGYLQFVIRNGGRTGVGFQGGLMYKL